MEAKQLLQKAGQEAMKTESICVSVNHPVIIMWAFKTHFLWLDYTQNIQNLNDLSNFM